MKLNHKIIIKVDSKFPVDYEGEFMESVLTISQLKSLIIQQCVKLDSLKASQQIDEAENETVIKKE